MEEYDEITITIPVEKSMIKSRREQLYLNILKGLNDNLIIPKNIYDNGKEVFNDREGFIKFSEGENNHGN